MYWEGYVPQSFKCNTKTGFMFRGRVLVCVFWLNLLLTDYKEGNVLFNDTLIMTDYKIILISIFRLFTWEWLVYWFLFVWGCYFSSLLLFLMVTYSWWIHVARGKINWTLMNCLAKKTIRPGLAFKWLKNRIQYRTAQDAYTTGPQ